MQSAQTVVLDMDETLIHTFQDLTEEEEAKLKSAPHLKLRLYTVETRDVLETRGSGIVEEMLAIERPYVNQFLRFCSKRFNKVYIWSAGQKDYVHKHVRRLSRSSNVNTVYTFDDCAVQDKPAGNGLIHKPLEKFGLDPRTTFIVDDRETAYLENPKNGIAIPRYNPSLQTLMDENKAVGTNQDMSLVRLMSYFIRPDVIHAKDVRSLRKNIYATPATIEYPLSGVPWIASGGGNCMFESIVYGLNEDRVFAHAAEQHLVEMRRRNPKYNMILERRSLSRLLDPEGLRYVIAATYLNDPIRTSAYLDHCRVIRGTPPADQNKWMEEFWTGSSYSTDAFLKSLLDRSKYWGDYPALEILASILRAKIVVWDSKTKKFIFSTEEKRNIMCTVNLLYDGGHYDFISDNCTDVLPEEPLEPPKALPTAKKPPTRKRQRP